MSKRFLTGLLCAAALAGGCSGSYTTTTGRLDTAANTTVARTEVPGVPLPAPPVAVQTPVPVNEALADWSDFGESPPSASSTALDEATSPAAASGTALAGYTAWSDFGESPSAESLALNQEEPASYAMTFEKAGAQMGDRYANWSPFGESPSAAQLRFANWSDFGESPAL